MPCEQNPLDGRGGDACACVKIFAPVGRADSRLLHLDDRTHQAKILHRFCEKLDDTEAQSIQEIQQTFGNGAMGKTQIKVWTTASSMATPQWKARHIQEVHPQAEVVISTGSAHPILTVDL